MALERINDDDSGLISRNKINDTMDAVETNSTDIQTNVTDISNRELLSNKKTDLTNPNDTTYPTTKAVSDAIGSVSGDNIYNANGSLTTNRTVSFTNKFLKFEGTGDNGGADVQNTWQFLTSSTVQQFLQELYGFSQNDVFFEMYADDNNNQYLKMRVNLSGDNCEIVLDKDTIKYSADKSSVFSDLSLIHKKYVVDNFSTTASNGINKNVKDFQLGGDLTKDTLIELNGKKFEISEEDDGGIIKFLSGLGYQVSSIQVQPDGIYFYISDGSKTNQLSIENDKILLSLGSGNTFEEAADYSANYTDRSYISKGFYNKNLNTKSFSAITADYTVQIGISPEVLMVDASGGDVVITLPATSSIPNDNKIHSFRIAKKDNSTNKVTIRTSTGDAFPQGITEIWLLYQGEVTQVGGSYDSGWFWDGQMKIVNKVDRTSAWDASNFSSLTAIPFENNIVDDNTQIFSWDSGEPTKIISEIANRINITYSINVDSTGGSTYNIEAYVYKNGVEVAGSKARTGNYGGEDSTMSKSNIIVEVNAGDYIEIFTVQNNLTGNIEFADMQVETLL